jgi:DNA-directed RNA polymerase specialized sigma subunit
MARKALALFNGRNAREVARRLGISRPHVYRLLKQPGGSV